MKCWKINLESYDVSLLDLASRKIKDLIITNNWKHRGPIPLPTHRLVISFTRAAHSFEQAHEQLERRTHKRVFFILNTDSSVNNAFKNLDLPNGVMPRLSITEIKDKAQGGKK
ncbi:MAG: 30S ribosomal protein S10 [Mycoplasmataceae bacterium]|nr:30S ribosomal protein S10 [Mycoplasmataceae bacterium]